MGRDLVVLRVVAGGDHEQHVRVARERVAHGAVERRPAERHVRRARPVRARVVDRLDLRRGRAARALVRARVGAHAQRHDAHVLCDAADADPVVAGGADRAGGVDAVAAVDQVVVRRVAVGRRRVRLVPDEVRPVRVVDDPVVVVVHAVRRVAGVRPGDRPEVGRVEAVAGVEVGDHGRGAAARAVPRRERVHVGTGERPGEALDPRARVPQPPLLAEQRVVRRRVQHVERVARRRLHIRVVAQGGDRIGDALARLRAQQLEARVAERLDEAGLRVAARRKPVAAVGARLPHDDHAIGDDGARHGRRRDGAGRTLAGEDDRRRRRGEQPCRHQRAQHHERDASKSRAMRHGGVSRSARAEAG